MKALAIALPIVIATLIIGFMHLPPASAANSASEAATVKTLSIDDVEAFLSDPTAKIYDANSPAIYAAKHIPGAVNLGFDAVALETLPEDKSTRMVFYCMNAMCSASGEAAKRAAALGYSNVGHMPAGIQGWIKAGKPVDGAAY